MNISDYIAANSWGYDVTQTSQTTSTKPFTIPAEEQKTTTATQKTLNNASTNPFEAGSFDFKNWTANLDPNYDRQMLTKTEATRSDEEILKDMAELGKKQAQRGVFQEYDEEFLSLYKEYISSVSPDREGILNRTMNEIIDRTRPAVGNADYTMSDIYQQLQSQMATQEEEDEKKKDKKEPIDYFIEMLANRGKGKGSSGGTISSITGSGDCYQVNIDHGGGMTTNLSYANGELTSLSISGNNYLAQLDNSGSAVQNGMIKDENGEIIARFGKAQGSNDFRFHAFSTNAEIERKKEIVSAYNAGYDVVVGRRNPLGKIYDDIYDGLTSGAVA